MRQSTFTFVAVMVAFVVFVTMRGELRSYLRVLGLAS